MSVPTRPTMLPIVEDGKILGEMPIDLSVQCATCKHWTENLQCEAFPELIPEAIWSGKFDHTQPFDGDNGILYERSERVIDPVEGAG